MVVISLPIKKTFKHEPIKRHVSEFNNGITISGKLNHVSAINGISHSKLEKGS